MSRHDATAPDPAVGSGRSAPAPDQRGPSPARTLHVSADLRVQVSAPDGRTAQVVVRDDAGTVQVLLARPGDLGVLRASLPGGVVGVASQLARLSRRGQLPLPPWDQPVEVTVGTAVVLRRRGGRWSPGPRLVIPAAAVAAGTLAVLGVGVLVIVLGRRRRG